MATKIVSLSEHGRDGKGGGGCSRWADRYGLGEHGVGVLTWLPAWWGCGMFFGADWGPNQLLGSGSAVFRGLQQLKIE